MRNKRYKLENIEIKLDTGLDNSINALIAWVKGYLQSEQKKSDFKPETDVDTMASSACLDVVKYLMQAIGQIQKCVDGENLTVVMDDFGVKFHRTIFDHLQQFQFNSAG